MPIKEIYIDVETTGLLNWKHGIIQIAGIVDIENEIEEEFDFKVRPFETDEIDPAAMVVHGYTAEEVREEPFLPPKQVHARLTNTLGKYVDRFNPKDKGFFIGYNCIKFDADFLRGWFKKCDDKYYGSWFWNPPLDVFALAANALRYGRHKMTDMKLPTVAKAFGIDFDFSKAHDAMYDVRITREIYKKIRAMGVVEG